MTQQERDEIRALVLSFSTKISDLPEVEALQDGDYVVVVQNDGSKKHSKKATLESLLELIKVYYPDHNGAKYQGVAHPSDTNVQVPVGTDGFWFAIDAGVYTNYGGITVTNAPKALFYNATTHEWSGEELWGDINGTVGFRLITGTAENSLDTFKIPVIAGRDYIISALAKPTGTFATLNIYEYDYNGTLINTTGYHVPEHSFVPRPGVDYIKISLGYNSSNPIDASLSEVRISSSIRNLVEGITNFVVDVLQGDYETRIDSLENYVEGAIGNLTTNLGALTTRVESAEGNITDLQIDALGIHADIENAQGDILNLDIRADALELDMTNAQGDILDLDVRASGISTRLENAEGDIDELSITAEGLEQRVTNAEGDVHTLQSTATTLESQITATDGRVSTLRQTVDEIDARVENAEGDVAGLAIEAHRIDLYAQSISESLGDYETFANGIMEGLQDQLDGVVDTYFYDYMPVHEDATGAPDSQVPLIEITIEGVTVPCEPYASWYNTDHGGTAQEVNTERLKHLGDVFYDNKSGYAFRFSNTGTEENPVFAWVEIQDSAVIKALADAARAQDTADHKRRVFVYSVTYPTPYAPYDVGDLWVKPVTVGTGASAQNTTELYRCKTARARTTDVFPFNPAVNTDTTSDYCDWEPADGKAEIVTKSNLQVLSDAIVGQTTQIVYNDDGTISSQSTASIQTTAGQIRLNVANGAIDTAVGPDGKITTPLLGTGIDIINGDITLIANHISLKNQSDITGLELITLGESPNQRVVIDVTSLNVNGIFSTSPGSVWATQLSDIKSYADTAAGDAYDDAVEQAATNASEYITNNVVPLITEVQDTADSAQAGVDGMQYLANALGNGTTAIGGGLILTSLVGLGGNSGTGGAWELWSGINGQYDSSKPGNGIGAWYGGNSVDCITVPNWATMTAAERLAAWDTYRYARSLFRLDGSGYLASGAITWGASGDLHLMDNIYIGAGTSNPFSEYLTFLTKLATWFEDVEEVIGGVSRRMLRINMNGTAAGGTDFAGLEFNGFLMSGGDQIVGSGTPGGGGGGGASSLWQLDDVNVPSEPALIGNGQMLAWNSSISKWVNVNAPTGTITSVALEGGTNNGTLKLTVNGTPTDNIAVTGWSSKADASALNYYLPLTAGSNKALTGTLYLKPGQYYADYGTWALDAQGSDIMGLNALYFADDADSTGEGFNFYRSSGYWDTLYARGGVLCFEPNRATTSRATSYTILHSGNYSSYSPSLTGTNASGTWGIDISGKSAYADAVRDPDYHSYPSGRRTSANLNYNDGALHYYLATSSMTTGYPGSDGAILHCGGDNTAWNTQLYIPLSGNNIKTRWSDGNATWSDWKTIAFTTDNVASATQLQTSRTIWGQSFNGTADITGSMSGVGNITMSGVLNVNAASGNRSTINLISPTDVPNDLWFGNGWAQHFSLSSRGTDDGSYFGLYCSYSGGGSWTWKASFAYPSIVDFSASPSVNGDIIYHAGNSNKSTVDWNCYNLTIGDVSHDAQILKGGTSGQIVYASNSFVFFGSASYESYLDGSSIYFRTSGSERMRITSGGNIGIGVTSPSYNVDISGQVHAGRRLTVGYNVGDWDRGRAELELITERDDACDFWMGANSLRKWGIAARPSGESYRLILYNGSWSETLRFEQDKTITTPVQFNVGRNFGLVNANRAQICLVTPSDNPCDFWMGANSTRIWSINVRDSGEGNSLNFYNIGYGHVAYLTRAGVFTTAGDQVISSDINKKTHFQNINLSVEQIANAPAVTFDWKDGHGHSFGSIAQYWKPLVPEAVLGKEGDYTLAYGQLGVILSINNGKAIYKIEQHETEQDKEIRTLRKKVADLEKEVKQLRS